MANLAASAHRWDRKLRQCKAVIETPKGKRAKFHYDPEYDAFSLAFILPRGLAFPFDFGFIPSTLAPDGDPLDVMILIEEPTNVGCVLDVRIIGVLEADQADEGKWTENDRLIGVAITSYPHQEIRSLDEIPAVVLDQVEEFFLSYNKSRGKKFKIKGRHGPKRAAAAVEAAIEAFEKKQK